MASKDHYYVPDHSVWPLVATVGLFTLLASTGTIMINYTAGKPSSTAWFFLIVAIGLMVFMLFGWFGRVVKESRARLYNEQVDKSFRWGMSWFIFSEVMFFLAFFGALFYVREFALPWLSGHGGRADTAMLWPHFTYNWPLLKNPDPQLFQGPKSGVDAWGIAFFNTILLVTSSVTVTIAHKCLKSNNRRGLTIWLALTIVLGVTFLGCQAFEYHHVYTALGMNLGAGIYSTTFFMLTGFHGLHVTIGAITLTVMLVRVLRGHFSPDYHFGFEAASWYWHFVDVVWICLFVFVYIL